MIDMYSAGLRLDVILHRPEGQQLVFRGDNTTVSVLLSLAAFEDLYIKATCRAETLDCFEPAPHGRNYRLKANHKEE